MSAVPATRIETEYRTIDGLQIRMAESEANPGQPTVLLTSPWPESLHAFKLFEGNHAFVLAGKDATIPCEYPGIERVAENRMYAR